MADNNNAPGTNFNEAVCIDVGRVYDSCCDRDCLEDLRCYFSSEGQLEIDRAVSVRLKSAEVLNVFVDVEQVNFNRGYYSCDLTFFFLVNLEVFTTPHSCPITVKGIAVFSKKVILFGSEGNVKVFSNTQDSITDSCGNNILNTPKCVVQTVEPIALGAKLAKVGNCCCSIGVVPDCVCKILGGNIVSELEDGSKTVYVTLGLFSIVQLIRNVQMLIPVYDFCIPDKQCNDACDQPCDVFRKIKFPTDDFFPPKGTPEDCGCNE